MILWEDRCAPWWRASQRVAFARGIFLSVSRSLIPTALSSPFRSSPLYLLSARFMVCKYYLPRDVCRVYVRLGCRVTERKRDREPSERYAKRNQKRETVDEGNVTRKRERMAACARDERRWMEYGQTHWVFTPFWSLSASLRWLSKRVAEAEPRNAPPHHSDSLGCCFSIPLLAISLCLSLSFYLSFSFLFSSRFLPGCLPRSLQPYSIPLLDMPLPTFQPRPSTYVGCQVRGGSRDMRFWIRHRLLGFSTLTVLCYRVSSSFVSPFVSA